MAELTRKFVNKQTTRDYNKFNKSLTEMLDVIEANVDSFLRDVTGEFYREIVRHTPVDTGKAKGNWQIANELNSNVLPRKRSREQVIVQVPHSIDFGKPVHIFNNVPYIQELENGHSKQQTQGMVKPAINNMRLKIPIIAKKYGL